MDDEYEVESSFNKKYNLLTRKIVRLLSENSRMSIAKIAKRLVESKLIGNWSAPKTARGGHIVAI